MRIAIANPYFVPAWGYGGPTRLLYELAVQLVSRGNQVTVLTTTSADGPKAYPPGEEMIDGVQVVRIPILSQRLAYRYKKFIALSYRTALKKILVSADTVQFCGGRDSFITAGATLCMHLRKKYAVAAYGALAPNRHGWKLLGTPAYDRLFTRRVIGHAARCFAQTKHESELYTLYTADANRIRVIPLGADGCRFHQLPPRGCFRNEFGFSRRERLILFVGRIHVNKGLDTLVSSFARVRKEEPLARLVIVGRDDGHEAAVKQRVRELGLGRYVKFVGPLYHERALMAYRDADVFTLTPRLHEETTLAGVEACFCGTQALVTEQAEIPHLVSSGGGFVVKHDTAEISETLLTAVSKESDGRKRGDLAREMAYKYFDWLVVAPQYLDAYREIVQ